MTTPGLLAALRGRGVRLEAIDGRLRVVAPRGVLSPELRATLTARKVELVALLAEADRHFQADRRRQYEILASDVGSYEDARILAWLTAHGHEALVGELLDLDRRCHELAGAGAPEADFRAAVAAFVGRVKEMRACYRRESQS